MRLVIGDVLSVFGFFTRLPVWHTPPAGRAFTHALWATPVAGWFVAASGAAVFASAATLDLGASTAALLAVSATMLATGCFHEDGLSDVADGFGGGRTKADKLRIMKDSRLGTYGAAALILSIGLRWSALSGMAGWDGAAALVAAHGASRAMLPLFLRAVRPASEAGLAAGLSDIPTQTVGVALLLGVVSLVPLGVSGALVGVLLLMAFFLALRWLCLRQIGGQTGDVCGALQQCCEIAVLLLASGLF